MRYQPRKLLIFTRRAFPFSGKALCRLQDTEHQVGIGGHGPEILAQQHFQRVGRSAERLHGGQHLVAVIHGLFPAVGQLSALLLHFFQFGKGSAQRGRGSRNRG